MNRTVICAIWRRLIAGNETHFHLIRSADYRNAEPLSATIRRWIIQLANQWTWLGIWWQHTHASTSHVLIQKVTLETCKSSSEPVMPSFISTVDTNGAHLRIALEGWSKLPPEPAGFAPFSLSLSLSRSSGSMS